ncbi:methyl-accepting chemotaxis protein [Celerinatantimonas yamalensis]|uniref:Methyl-accepting chemotaxis protein n=1 Tax=Celerinatantimonas yamalensis TaxID=559956 RepID=A0ABW9G7L3_9GAMM
MNFRSYHMRILLAFISASILFAIALGVSIYENNKLSQGFTHLESKENTYMSALNHMFNSGLFGGIAVRNKVFKPALTKPAAVVEQTEKDFQTALSNAQRLTTENDPAALKLLDDIKERWAIVQKARRQVMTLVEQGEQAKAIELLTTVEHPSWQKIRVALQTLMRQQEQIVKQLSQKVRRDSATMQQVSIAVGALAFVVGFVLFFLVLRGFRQAMRHITLALDSIADGEGDLTLRLDEKDGSELSQIADGFNRFIDKIQTLVKDVVVSTEQLASSAAQMSTITHQSRQDIKSQLQETDMIATSIEELATSVREVSRNTSAAADQSRDTETESAEGFKIVQSASQAVETLSSNMSDSSKIIHSLAQESDHIDSVLTVISQISEQTNLLALNAAIEAARAGEQGRGFAVVADEVRTLAGRTGSATLEIRAMIERLQQSSANAVESMQKSSDNASESVMNANAALTALTSIRERAKTQMEQSIQIAAAVEEQEVVAKEISHNVNNIRTITNNASTNSEQIALSGDQLAQLASQLRGIVSHFKVV